MPCGVPCDVPCDVPWSGRQIPFPEHLLTFPPDHCDFCKIRGSHVRAEITKYLIHT